MLQFPQMAVIKSLDLVFGHMFNGRYAPEMSVVEALRIIKLSKEDHDRIGEISYIGEREMVDVDITKINCESCKLDLNIQMGAERRG